MADPTTASGPLNMKLYHGSEFGSDLQLGTIDPLKHSSGRTPLPAFTMTDRAGAERYARTGGPGQSKAFAGPLYEMDVQFDSPTRIVGAYDQASDDFVQFMRNSLPEESVRAPLVPGGKPGITKPRELFDQSIGSLVESGDRTNYAVMDALSTVHETYRPLGDYDYLPRAQASIEARRFGIDALTWNDFGDDVVALLDPEDLRSNVGRRNISSVTELDMLSPSPASGPSLDAIKAAMGDSLPSSVEPDTPKKLTPEQQSKLDEVIEAQRQHKEAVENSVGSTKKAIEQDGYLYHYAPREARDSILAEGLLPSKASTADVLDNGIYFFTNPKDAPSASSVMAVSGRTSADSAGLDLYRVKVDPDMLDGMVIDSKLPIRGNVASAVVVPTKTGSFIPELIGENARFESSGELLDLFSKADYDPIVTDSAPSATAKVVSETAAVEPIAKEHSPRKIAALEEMAENGTVHEKEIAKRKLEEIKNTQNRVRGSGLNIGTPTDDIRTRPTPKGTDAASRSVVDSGGTRPIINVEPPKPDTIKPPVDKPADVSAKITTDSTSPVKNVPDTSSRITKITSTGRKIKDNGMDVAKNISSGNARTMGIAAIAGLLGAGAYGLNKKKEEDIQSRVNRQRYGEM
jgi:hypothetical protein